MRHSILSCSIALTVSVVAAFGLLGCRGADDPSQTMFEVNNWARLQYSPLWEMSKSGSFDACVAVVNAPDAVADAEIARVIEAVRGAIQEWTAPLVGEPGWMPVSVNVNVVGTVKGFIWPQRAVCTTFLGYYALPPNPDCKQLPCERSFAKAHQRAVFIDPGYLADLTYRPRLSYVVRHELGHVLGVADTYGASGAVRPGQPISTMSKHNAQMSSDDIAAIKATWSIIYAKNTGQPVVAKCPAGYKAEMMGFVDENGGMNDVNPPTSSATVDAPEQGLACVPDTSGK